MSDTGAFELALEKTQAHEGGEKITNDPADPGGRAGHSRKDKDSSYSLPFSFF